jgi:hypothetical protein
MDKIELYSDCGVMVTKLWISKNPKKTPGVVFTAIDQIKDREISACMSRSQWETIKSFIDTEVFPKRKD